MACVLFALHLTVKATYYQAVLVATFSGIVSLLDFVSNKAEAFIYSYPTLAHVRIRLINNTIWQ